MPVLLLILGSRARLGFSSFAVHWPSSSGAWLLSQARHAALERRATQAARRVVLAAESLWLLDGGPSQPVSLPLIKRGLEEGRLEARVTPGRGVWTGIHMTS
jgi:hypothetical protein